MPKKDQ